MKATLLTALAWLAILAAPASAYPQYQLSFEPACGGCHVSPTGGGLLGENGLAVAESKSHLGTAPEFLNGAITPPSWLLLGGDLRAAGGFIATPEKVLAAFPMQGELYAAALIGQVSVHVTAGFRPAQEGNRAATSVGSREHYVMWRESPSTNTGLVARAGRFMPVFGLRLAEHPSYTRRWGGTQLYADTYGAHVGYSSATIDAHVTGFIEDPLIDTVEHNRGGAAYAELRVDSATALAAEAMVSDGPDDKKLRYGVIAKRYLPGPRLLLQAEVQYVNQLVDATATDPRYGLDELVGTLVGSTMLGELVMLDVALSHFDGNIRIADLDRDAVDVNLHYFMTSHLELVWNSRFEMLAFGGGGPSSGYSLLQVHYRL